MSISRSEFYILRNMLSCDLLVEEHGSRLNVARIIYSQTVSQYQYQLYINNFWTFCLHMHQYTINSFITKGWRAEFIMHSIYNVKVRLFQ